MPNNTDPLTINCMFLRMLKSIPALFAGVLFFCTVASAQSTPELAEELFQEEEWTLCRRECRRAILATNDPSPRLQLMHIVCGLHTGDGFPEAAAELHPLTKQTDDSETSALAAFELGRVQWQRRKHEEALLYFAKAFQTATNQTLFLRAACSAFLVMEEKPSLRKGRSGLVQQINTSRELWRGELFGICRLPRKKRNLFGRPGGWLVSFYRTQISPAIGQRCTLEPSCSEYFRIASHRHGLLGIPMIADRFIREPTVNSEKKEPVRVNGMIRYRDSIDDHDFWMKR